METTWKSTALIISSMNDWFVRVFGVGIFTWQIVQCLLPVAVALFQTSIKRGKNLIKWKPANPKMGRVIHEAKKAKSIRKNWLTEYNTNDITSGILYHMMNTLICPLFFQIPVFVSISQEMLLAKSLQCIIGSIMEARITTLATQTVPAESLLFFAVCLLVIWDDALTSKALNWYKKRPPLSVVMCREYYSMNAKPTQDITASVRPSAPCTLSQ